MAKPNNWKVVLIDDEEDIRDVMSISLRDAGYEIATASDGETGIRLSRELSPHIVITDIRMPGINGIEVLENIKRLDPEIEVIVITAFGEIGLAIQALQLDASDFITKPVNDDALHLALKRAQTRHTNRKKIKDYTALLERENAQTTRELIKNITFQKNLIDNSMDGILACDENDRVVTFNRSMEQILGFSKDDVLHRMSLDQFFFRGQENRFKEDLYGDGYGGDNNLFLYETTLQDLSGRKIPVQVSASVLFEKGNRSGLVCFFRDLREIYRLEQEFADQTRVLHQDKMMSLGKLAASLVHEINNPLSGILNYIRLMIRIVERGALSDEQRQNFQRYLRLVETETDRCSQIVSNLLTFSRKSPTTMVPVRIEELLHRCTLLSQHKLELQDIRLETHVASNIPAIEGDLNQMQQCIINLIFNAIDAMPTGGVLTLSGDFDPESKMVGVTVRDTGTGISEEDLPYIFEPFFSTKKEGYGVGLGLSTVFGIMEHHHGEVTVESQKSEGTSFRLLFPV